MKKTAVSLVALIILFLPCRSVFASVGIKAGPSLSFAGESSAIYNASTLFGFRAGAFVSFNLAPVVSLQPGLDFVMKGARYYDVNWRATLSTHFDYLECPLLISVHMPFAPIDILAGPYLAWVVHSTPLNEGRWWTWRENALRALDYGLTAGLRYRLGWFFFELHYSHGLKDVLSNGGQDDWEVHKNRTAALLLGILI